MAELVRILTPILWHTARSSRLDTASAEDVLQTVWLTLVRKADSITEPLAVLQWMVVTTKREAWRVSRTQAKVRPEDMESGGTLERDHTESVEDAVIAHRDRESALAAHRRAAGALPRFAPGDRLRRPTRLRRVSQSAGDAAGQHRPHPGPLPGQAADRPRPRPQLGDLMNTSDDREIELEERLAAEKLDPSDYAILNSVRAFYDESDPVPDGLVERIQFEMTLDALHAEVATLTQLDLAASGARGTATEAVRTITFTSESLTTMVTLTRRRTARCGSTAGQHPAADPRSRCCSRTDRGRPSPTTTAGSSSTTCRAAWPSSPCTCRADGESAIVLTPTIEL